MSKSTSREKQNKRLICQTCSKTFSFLSDLRRHALSHLPNKQDYYYTCPYPDCGRSMAQSYNLKIHMRQHTGEELKCDSCDFKTPDNGYMLKHREKEHGILPKKSKRNPRNTKSKAPQHLPRDHTPSTSSSIRGSSVDSSQSGWTSADSSMFDLANKPIEHTPSPPALPPADLENMDITNFSPAPSMPQTSASSVAGDDSESATDTPPEAELHVPPAKYPPRAPNGSRDWLCDTDWPSPKAHPLYTPLFSNTSHHHQPGRRSASPPGPTSSAALPPIPGPSISRAHHPSSSSHQNGQSGTADSGRFLLRPAWTAEPLRFVYVEPGAPQEVMVDKGWKQYTHPTP